MGEQTRETLRKFFKAGQLPTEDHFGDLVDSLLNMKDDGFRKTPKNGLELSPPGDHEALLSFFRDRDPLNPIWSVGYGRENDRLQFNHRRPGADGDGAAPTLLCLHVEQLRASDGSAAQTLPRVGVATDAPRHTLDVAGVVAAQGRIGTFNDEQRLAAPADGQWHTIVDKLRGCHGFEVVAGVGGAPGSGRFALLHAIALNAYNPDVGWLDFLSRKRRIRATSAHYGRRCDRIALRWEGSHGKDAQYQLRIRTHCDYGAGVAIRFALTRLWFDPTMSQSAARPE